MSGQISLRGMSRIAGQSVTAFLILWLLAPAARSDIKSKQEMSREAKARVPHISAQQLASYLSDNEDFILLDVRTEAEYHAGHIRGAKWFPRGRLEFYIQELIRAADTRVVLYCRSGGRSALASSTMRSMGYSNVVDLEGGFEEWVAKGNAFYNLHGENKVLTYQKKE